MTTVKTSDTHPIYVSWLPVPETIIASGGRLGLTFAPGKHANSKYSAGRWERDLAKDLHRLATVEQVTDLVSLLPDDELRALGIANLVEEARKRGLTVVRFPFPDGGVPTDTASVRELVDDILRRLGAGAHVVLHCQGGLGRAGTIGGCVLTALGHDADSALAVLAEKRSPKCPETAAQKDFIRRFARERTTTSSTNPSTIATATTTTAPTRPPEALVRRARREAARGAVLGGAIGDALGHPTEFLSLDAIRDRWGPSGVRGFELWWTKDGKRFAPYTDDTQMAEQVLRALLQARATGLGDDLDATMKIMAARFVRWSKHPQGGHRAPGNACLAGCAALMKGVPWHEAGGATAGGCGSVMRAYPFGLVFSDDLRRAEHWAVAHSKLTHRDPIALAACAAMAVGVARLVRGDDVMTTASEMVAAACRYSPKTAVMMAQAIDDARSGVGPEVTIDRLRSWAAHEAIAAGVYLLVRHPDDARQALLEGANSPGDSDSIATLAGALLGARLGLGAFPPSWIEGVERSAELLALADLIVDGGAPDDLDAFRSAGGPGGDAGHEDLEAEDER